MNRRSFLKVVGLGVSGVGACSTEEEGNQQHIPFVPLTELADHLARYYVKNFQLATRGYIKHQNHDITGMTPEDLMHYKLDQRHTITTWIYVDPEMRGKALLLVQSRFGSPSRLPEGGSLELLVEVEKYAPDSNTHTPGCYRLRYVCPFKPSSNPYS